ncbi:MAG TPA: hypothetical protein VF192_01405 [Longimicrobiales bacterium]
MSDLAPIRTRRKPWCDHRLTELDPDSRRVFCRSCGEEVDAWEALRAIAFHWERYEAQVAALQKEAERLGEVVRKLKREERNAKARLRRAGKRPT